MWWAILREILVSALDVLIEYIFVHGDGQVNVDWVLPVRSFNFRISINMSRADGR